ncbi:uncharacterized protein SPAPADRAFT_59693 [Spathaspora passalidarum NRRL Y-27907]|uniref:Uncharacterized protein n=1 Tax=Spathaspora passalidarum (strain NRRL Y-27907 / 11-Y1) TaxID=619300 RepID=G3AHV9_SPAPN|nr:uncharacterized protein SPAPADRAFT_59693 [Spathaspora passalidarum NRRL Y-27907]EGW34273.1 hypothetical protein SPAPADRAFT_59693 [Spathaspora passalidarum NRRL Y-27907]
MSEYSEKSNELTAELTNEFKNAAKSIATLYNSSNSNSDSLKSDFTNAARSVASLYKITNNSRDMLFNHGYLSCLDDLLQVISQQGDVENWVLTKRAELLKKDKPDEENTKKEVEKQEISPEQVINIKKEDNKDTSIEDVYSFTFTSDIKPNVHFRPSIPPLSVQHNLKQRQSHMLSKRLEKIQRLTASDEDIQLEKLKLLQLQSSQESPPKKKKKI